MNKNISKKCVVQNAENKKVVTLKDTKNQENHQYLVLLLNN